MSYGSLWERWARGVTGRGSTTSYRARIPADLAATVMTLESRDRFHAKQGRSTARFVFHGGEQLSPARSGRSDASIPPLAVYLKRHFRLPWPCAAGGAPSPGRQAFRRGGRMGSSRTGPRTGNRSSRDVAAGERIGPGARLTSFLMVAELTGAAVNEILPVLAADSIGMRSPASNDE